MSSFRVLIILLLSLTDSSQGFKILGVLSTESKSRYSNIRNLAEELASRDHQVALIVSSGVPFRPSHAVKHFVLQSPFEANYLEKKVLPKLLKQSFSDIIDGFKTIVKSSQSQCRSVLVYVKSNLRDFQDYDLVFGDCPTSCVTLVAELLGLPKIEIVPAFVMRMALMEMGPISYIPVVSSSNTDKMNFHQRVENLLHYIMNKFLNEFVAFRYLNDLKQEFGINPESHFLDSWNMAELVLVMGHFALEYSQPILPGIKLVGPLTITPPKPLPQDLEQFVNGAGDKGVVLLSLGTLGDYVLQKHQVDMLAGALGRLEQRVIWRLKEHIPHNLASNIKIVGWIPQNDLLAHRSTRAFLSHTGHNSLYESAFYGVPLVCIPLFGDQLSNCLQAQSVGIAVGVDINTATEEDVYQSIQRVLKETSFKDNATRISRLLRDTPRTSVQQAADWIEYVHRHKGASHLRPEAFNLHWYQRYLLDVLAFIVFILFLIVCLIRALLRCLCALLCARKKTDLKAD